jgi:hypothetical protein
VAELGECDQYPTRAVLLRLEVIQDGAMKSIYHMIRVFTLRLLSIYQWLFEITDGGFTWFLGKPVLLLRTTGAKTGIQRRFGLRNGRDGSGYRCARWRLRHTAWLVLQPPEAS